MRSAEEPLRSGSSTAAAGVSCREEAGEQTDEDHCVGEDSPEGEVIARVSCEGSAQRHADTEVYHVCKCKGLVCYYTIRIVV